MKQRTSTRRFPVAKESLEFFIPFFGAGVLCLVFGVTGSGAFVWAAAIFFLALSVFILYFFRDPLRVCEHGPGVIVSPADGEIVAIRDVEEEEYLHRRTRRVSIYLRIYDVHMNYAPIDGTVEYKKYRKGRFGLAGFDKASELNEHMMLGISNGEEKLSFKVIAGMFARRIVIPAEEGSRVRAGERIGLIKFGSRADVFIPPEYEITVEMGQKVKGALTVIARRK